MQKQTGAIVFFSVIGESSSGQRNLAQKNQFLETWLSVGPVPEKRKHLKDIS